MPLQSLLNTLQEITNKPGANLPFTSLGKLERSYSLFSNSVIQNK